MKTLALLVTAKFSLSQPYENQILTPIDFFNFCQPKCKGIQTFYVSLMKLKRKHCHCENGTTMWKQESSTAFYLEYKISVYDAKKFSSSKSSVMKVCRLEAIESVCKHSIPTVFTSNSN